jgi:hypothetical protein
MDFKQLRLIEDGEGFDIEDIDAEMTEPLPAARSDVESEDDSDDMIPKPPGEAGRPACGGYNLETALGWKAATFNSISVSLSQHDLIFTHGCLPPEIHPHTSMQ